MVDHKVNQVMTGISPHGSHATPDLALPPSGG
jgi:hypothetical protein